MPTQDQQQYHFKLSDERCLCYTHTHTHATKRYTFIIGLKHNYHHDNHAHKYQYRQNYSEMQLFPKYWELSVSNRARPEPDL